MTYETILFEVRDRIAFVTMNRPEVGNAINRQMHQDLSDAWRRINADNDIWAAVITGAGADFSVGDDLDEMGASLEAGSAPEAWKNEIDWQGRYRGMNRPSGLPSPTGGLPGKPLIAAVHGRCHDSAITIVAHSDWAIGDDTARFGFPQVQAGLAPLDDVLVLSRLISRGAAVRLGLLGGREEMDAQRAYELGLLIDIAPAGEAIDRATDHAQKLADWSSPLAVWGSKAAMFSTYNLPYDKAQLMSHVYLNQVRFHADDAQEGPRAFAQKRKPSWKTEFREMGTPLPTRSR